MQKLAKISKVSVIVPVYKVERYLSKCIDSIIGQTYTELEIILVDDGSPDNCPKICDDYAAKDDRIKVIHKENGGLSDARNAGLDIASGDYITFIDSDDYVDTDYVETLVNTLGDNNADVACCRDRNVWENGKCEDIGNDNILHIYHGIEALKEYLYAKTIDPCAWGKLFRADILTDLRFIKGILGEDNPFCIELFKKTSTTVVIGKSKYNYLQERDGSITNSKITSKKLDSVYYWDSVRIDCKNNYPELEKYALRRQVLFYIGLYNSVLNDSTLKSDAEKVRTFIKAHNKEIQKCDICEKIVKISAFWLSVYPAIYNLMMKVYKKVIGRAHL